MAPAKYTDQNYLEEVKERDLKGILTERDVEVLLKDSEEYRDFTGVRYRIRQRIMHAIRDLAFLFHRLPNTDQRRLILNLRSEFQDDYSNLIIDAPAFLFRGTYGAERYLEETPIDPYPDFDLEARTETFTRRLVYRSEIVKGVLPEVDVEVDIDLEQPSPEVVRQKILEGDGDWDLFHYLTSIDEFTPLLEEIVESGEPVDLIGANDGSEEFIGPKKAKNWLEELKEQN